MPLAGNVLAGVFGGDLNIQGDVQDNQIALRDLGGGAYQVEGLNGTTVNGLPSMVFGGVGGAIRADLMRGDDQLVIDKPFQAPGNLEIQMGHGNDQVLLTSPAGGSIDVLGSLSILTDAGKDVVRLGGVRVVGNVIIDTGEDSDWLSAHQLMVGGHFALAMRGGDDAASLSATLVKGVTRIMLGDGNDTLRIGGRSHFVGTFNADLGAGNDRFQLADTVFESEFGLFGGDGDDYVSLSGKVRFLKTANFILGDGNDKAEVASTALIENAASVNWDGGAGFDAIFDNPANYLQPALVSHINFP